MTSYFQDDGYVQLCMHTAASAIIIMKKIYPKLSYSEALEKSGLVLLDTRREEITQCTFRQVKCPTHPLHCSITCKVFTSQMRPTYPFQLQSVKKSRCGRYLIPYCIAKKY